MCFAIFPVVSIESVNINLDGLVGWLTESDQIYQLINIIFIYVFTIQQVKYCYIVPTAFCCTVEMPRVDS